MTYLLGYVPVSQIELKYWDYHYDFSDYIFLIKIGIPVLKDSGKNKTHHLTWESCKVWEISFYIFSYSLNIILDSLQKHI